MKKFWSILAVSLVICMIVPMVFTASAGVALDPDQLCQLTVSVPNTTDDLLHKNIEVDVYRVASVNAYCQFTALEGFEDLQLVAEAEGTDFWQVQMQKAFKTIVDKNGEIAPVATSVIENETVTFTDLATGIYLVVPHMQDVAMADYVTADPETGDLATTFRTSHFDYTFTPNMLALPYSDNGTTGGDEWFYEASLNLKPTQTHRVGKLLIQKNLVGESELSRPATFYFEIEAKYEDEVVYSNVVGIEFDGLGTQVLEVTGPEGGFYAGTVVTVTELMIDGSFHNEDLVQTAVIIADGEEGSPVMVSFTNTYEPDVITGADVLNTFAYDGEGWVWEPVYSGGLSVNPD